MTPPLPEPYVAHGVPHGRWPEPDRIMNTEIPYHLPPLPPVPYHLPPLPPVPGGFDRWVYRGQYWVAPANTPHAVYYADDKPWVVWFHADRTGTPGRSHYLEAVRDTAIPTPEAVAEARAGFGEAFAPHNIDDGPVTLAQPRILFLGGPADGRRLPDPATEYQYFPVLPPVATSYLDLDPDPSVPAPIDRVLYRRERLLPCEDLEVYISADLTIRAAFERLLTFYKP